MRRYRTLLRRREELRVAVLKLMADHQLDALIYATFDAAPTLIAEDVLTNPRPNDRYGLGDNRGHPVGDVDHLPLRARAEVELGHGRRSGQLPSASATRKS